MALVEWKSELGAQYSLPTQIHTTPITSIHTAAFYMQRKTQQNNIASFLLYKPKVEVEKKNERMNEEKGKVSEKKSPQKQMA